MLYTKNNPSLTNFVVNSGFTLMMFSFGLRLREKLDEAGIKPAELARLSGVTKQNIGRLLNNTPHSITGALPKVERETVEKIAKALAWDISDALTAAGYASNTGFSFEIAEDVRVSLLHGKEFTQQDQEDFAQAFEVAYQIALQRIKDRK